MRRVLLALLLVACTVYGVRLVEHSLDPLLDGIDDNSDVDRFGRSVDPVDPPHHVAGYFELNRTTSDGHMFYFYFESATKHAADQPVVLWLTGGPGCSSELAVFKENGPYEVVEGKTLKARRTGWDQGHNMIFVDQPINTGFSYSSDPADRVFNEQVVASDMLDFLQHFFDARPHLRDNDFYITGESYAGHYIPAVAHHLWKANKSAHESRRINLKGLAIGNGLTDPLVQYKAYAEFALQNDLISQTVHDSMSLAYPVCAAAIAGCDKWRWAAGCLAALETCQTVAVAPIMALNPGMNVYDIRKDCVGPLCYDFSDVDAYLRQPHVQDMLGVTGRTDWEMCDMQVNHDMLADEPLSFQDKLPAMLDDGVRVMIYAGEKDFICNWVGNRAWVDQLLWSGTADWVAADDFDWEVDGTAAGRVKTAGALTFVKVAGAGHMVPMDQPGAALDMITRFTRDRSFKPEEREGGSRPVASRSAMGGLEGRF